MITWRGGRTLLAIKRLGKNARRGGFANTAHTCKQVGVSHTLGTNGILQSVSNMLLAGNIFETLGPPFARDD
jgi:hypothetical protein